MERIDETRMTAWRAFLEGQARVLEALGRELEAEHGLTLSAYEVLLYLYEEPSGSIRMQELAGRVLLSKSGLTRLVDRLEAEGLVSRRACPTDRRGVEATLTDLGRRRFRAAGPTHLRGIAEHFTSHLTKADAEAVIRTMRKVTGALSARRTA